MLEFTQTYSIYHHFASVRVVEPPNQSGNGCLNSPMFSASIRPLRLMTTSPFAALVIFSAHPLLSPRAYRGSCANCFSFFSSIFVSCSFDSLGNRNEICSRMVQDGVFAGCTALA